MVQKSDDGRGSDRGATDSRDAASFAGPRLVHSAPNRHGRSHTGVLETTTDMDSGGLPDILMVDREWRDNEVSLERDRLQWAGRLVVSLRSTVRYLFWSNALALAVIAFLIWSKL